MLNRLKKSALGQRLYVLSRGEGWLAQRLRDGARMAQAEWLQLAHLMPANRAHNRRQTATLKAFEDGLGPRP